ncbi:hypothetical protein GRS96_12455 [Rathayibacter sp. VKM Ac-2803]|uniref:hypothetical protein n=1 Tax=Rathayibacter sp. VKM Ac-2803 TaxID=2609256 RepID=UPI00135A16C9|nr:hypothetical protein [Rathayibacter sp. VKM Ac-2803]MWV50080.1 hypothetical protein [Rathayibacter sp. VKM Ac-2803]
MTIPTPPIQPAQPTPTSRALQKLATAVDRLAAAEEQTARQALAANALAIMQQGANAYADEDVALARTPDHLTYIATRNRLREIIRTHVLAEQAAS